MEQSEIKKECDVLYNVIDDAQKRLKEIRQSCKHPNTFQGNYSWRPGTVTLANICSDCGSVITGI